MRQRLKWMVDRQPENDFTNRNTTLKTRDLIPMARLLKEAGGIASLGNFCRQRNAGEHFDCNPECR